MSKASLVSGGLWRQRRWIFAAIEGIVLLGLPFIQIGGNSALRFDLPSLSLHFFGTRLMMDEFFIVLTALLFVLFLFMALTILFGRLWCGWACPQTMLSDIIELAKGPWRFVIALSMSLIISANIIWYFIPPYEFISMLMISQVTLWFFMVMAAIIFVDLAFVRRIFCTTICPYAKMQGVLYDERTLLIAYDPAQSGECLECRACSRACPAGIDIRDGLQSQCISCAACIDACVRKQAKKDRPSLVGYHFGDKPSSSSLGAAHILRRPLRVNALIMLLASAVFLALLLSGLATREDFTLSASQRLAFVSREANAPNGLKRLTNAYRVTMMNRTERVTVYELRVKGAEVKVMDELVVEGGGAKTFDIYVTITYETEPPEMINIEVASIVVAPRGTNINSDKWTGQKIAFPSSAD